MDSSAEWYVKSDEGKVYGPADMDKLVTWAEEGRIDSVSFVSQDRLSWLPAPQLPQLKMQWLVETEPGKVFGPFNRVVAIRIFKEKMVPQSSRIYRLYEFAVDQDPPPPLPPAKIQHSFFGNFDRGKLMAIEAAARRELAAVQRKGAVRRFEFLGGKKR